MPKRTPRLASKRRSAATRPTLPCAVLMRGAHDLGRGHIGPEEDQSRVVQRERERSHVQPQHVLLARWSRADQQRARRGIAERTPALRQKLAQPFACEVLVRHTQRSARPALPELAQEGRHGVLEERHAAERGRRDVQLAFQRATLETLDVLQPALDDARGVVRRAGDVCRRSSLGRRGRQQLSELLFTRREHGRRSMSEPERAHHQPQPRQRVQAVTTVPGLGALGRGKSVAPLPRAQGLRGHTGRFRQRADAHALQRVLQSIVSAWVPMSAS